MLDLFDCVQELSLSLKAEFTTSRLQSSFVLQILKSPPPDVSIQLTPDEKCRVEFPLDSELNCIYLFQALFDLETIRVKETHGSWSRALKREDAEQLTQLILLGFCDDRSTALRVLVTPDDMSNCPVAVFEEQVFDERFGIPRSSDAYVSARLNSLKEHAQRIFAEFDIRVTAAYKIGLEDIEALLYPYYTDQAFHEFVAARKRAAEAVRQAVTANVQATAASLELQRTTAHLSGIPLDCVKTGSWPTAFQGLGPTDLANFLAYWRKNRATFSRHYDLYQTAVVCVRRSLESAAGPGRPPLGVANLLSSLELLLQDDVVCRHDPNNDQIHWSNFEKDAWHLGVEPRVEKCWPTAMESAVRWSERAYVARHVFWSLENCAKAKTLTADDAERAASLALKSRTTPRFKVPKKIVTVIANLLTKSARHRSALSLLEAFFDESEVEAKLARLRKAIGAESRQVQG